MMTTEQDKQLLLKDLCARLPYGVKVKYLYWDEDKGFEYPVPMILDDINSDGYIRFHGDIAEGEGRGYILTYLPYLRPLSSMTEEEEKEYELLIDCSDHTYFKTSDKVIDWLNEHQFNYRLPSHLFIEAPNGMYKTE